jgi:hypothetical protein
MGRGRRDGVPLGGSLLRLVGWVSDRFGRAGEWVGFPRPMSATARALFAIALALLGGAFALWP